MLNNYPSVSIIVPVYNAAKTLPICLKSLYNIDYPVLEIIFIDDYSSDDSPILLEKFKEKSKCKELSISICTHLSNLGVAAARNTGLSKANGKYIYYIDADDRVNANIIKLTVEKAEEEQAEIIGFNWFLSFEKNERKMAQPSFSTPWDAIQKMFEGTMRWNLWLFLVKRSLYEDNNIRFIPNMNMGEDLFVMTQLFTFAKRVSFVNEALYHYRQTNQASITKVYSQQHIEQATDNLRNVELFVKQHQYASKSDQLIAFLKLNIKLPFLISADTEQYRKWLAWFPETNHLVMKNKALPFRTRLLQWCAVKKQFWLLKIYYYFVIRFIYGIIYK